MYTRNIRTTVAFCNSCSESGSRLHVASRSCPQKAMKCSDSFDQACDGKDPTTSNFPVECPTRWVSWSCSCDVCALLCSEDDKTLDSGLRVIQISCWNPAQQVIRSTSPECGSGKGVTLSLLRRTGLLALLELVLLVLLVPLVLRLRLLLR